MLEILTYQVIAAGVGATSIGAADWLYHRGRIRQRPHDLWVSASSTATCSPLIIWTTDVFLGIGTFSVALIGTIAMIMFLWIYRSLQKLSDRPKPGMGRLVSASSRQPVSSAVASFWPDAAAETSYLTGPISRRAPKLN